MTPAFFFRDNREPNWMAHTEFTLRPRFARTGVVGHDNVGIWCKLYSRANMPDGTRPERRPGARSKPSAARPLN